MWTKLSVDHFSAPYSAYMHVHDDHALINLTSCTPLLFILYMCVRIVEEREHCTLECL